MYFWIDKNGGKNVKKPNCLAGSTASVAAPALNCLWDPKPDEELVKSVVSSRVIGLSSAPACPSLGQRGSPSHLQAVFSEGIAKVKTFQPVLKDLRVVLFPEAF